MEPVDPEEDNAFDYFDIIKRPSDLGLVQRKLTNGEYKTVAQFKEELGLIWSNCIKYNGEDSLMGAIAADLKQFSERLLVFLSDSPEIDWLNELVFLVEELSNAVKTLNFSSLSGKKRASSTASIKQYDTAPVDDGIEDISYTHDEIEQLGKDIGSLTNDTDVLAIFDTLKENQPRLVGEKTNVTLNLCSLSPQTLSALMKKRDEIFEAAKKAEEEHKEEESSLPSRSDTSTSTTTSTTTSSDESETESDE